MGGGGTISPILVSNFSDHGGSCFSLDLFHSLSTSFPKITQVPVCSEFFGFYSDLRILKYLFELVTGWHLKRPCFGCGSLCCCAQIRLTFDKAVPRLWSSSLTQDSRHSLEASWDTCWHQAAQAKSGLGVRLDSRSVTATLLVSVEVGGLAISGATWGVPPVPYCHRCLLPHS